tara:strand:+ start:639 stop:1415 length:777 start_codon:yes stop_codon:yes gene_type:complete
MQHQLNPNNNNAKKPSKTSSFGNTPLMHAIMDGDDKAVDRLLNEGANIEATDIHGHTPLMLAVIFERIDVIKTLLKMGANIHTKDKTQATALDIALSHKNKDALYALRPKQPSPTASLNKTDIKSIMLGVNATERLAQEDSSTSSLSDSSSASSPREMEGVTTQPTEDSVTNYIATRESEPEYNSTASKVLSCLRDYSKTNKLDAAKGLDIIVQKAIADNQSISIALRDNKSGLFSKHGEQLNQGRLGDIVQRLRLRH